MMKRDAGDDPDRGDDDGGTVGATPDAPESAEQSGGNGTTVATPEASETDVAEAPEPLVIGQKKRHTM